MYKPTTLWCQPSLPSLFKITVLGSALLTLGLTGCSSTPSASKAAKTQQVGAGYLDAGNLDGLGDLLSASEMRAVEGDRLLILKHGDVWKRMTIGFQMENSAQWNPRIDAQRGWFISRQPYLDRLSARASRYLYHTVKEAERRGMPTELALLPVIESSYDPAATSSAAAAGLWQFIPSTGRIYGLQQTTGYDGRRDVVESTRAAYEFLGSLYNQFGSWELALAAYNAGPGRIQQAINRNKAAGLPTDYWSLKLPQETMNYVPRFLAVAQIIKNPQQYNVRLPPIANRPHFRELHVGTVSLNDISSITGLSRAELYQLNPGHRGDRIDASSPQRILIPADLSPSIDEKLKKLSGTSVSTLLATAKPVATVKTPVQQNQPVVATKPTTTVAATPAKPTTAMTTAPVVTAAVQQPSQVTNSIPPKRVTTPRGSTALAEFASQSHLPIPSAPRIPVAVAPVTAVKAIQVEPAITASERKQIEEAVRAENMTTSVDEILKPIASSDEQARVVAEIKAIAPLGTEIVDPYDGKIKLTAIQTSLSVAEQQGKELTKGFAYPKDVADNTKADSVEAKLNQNKNFVKTESDIIAVAPKGKRSSYTVASGDTLALIAAKNGLNWRDVAKWNQIDPSAPLYVGTTVYLYDAKPVVEAAKPKEKPESYVVQANDTLTGIAQQFGLSLKDLADFNGLNTNSGVFVGQKLSLKATAISTAKQNDVKETKKAETSKVATQVYTVKRGEYLKLIADRYALSNVELAGLTDGLTANSSLMVGQKINVPLQDVSAATQSKVEQKIENVKVDQGLTENYQVQRGETLYSIANQSKMTVSELAALNGLSAQSGLRIGQTLKLPVGSTIPESYTIQSGDTLTGIAAKYGLGLDHITNLNNMSRSSGLRVGQQIKLKGDVADTVKAPENEIKTEKATDIHVVKSGETLSSIARQYHLQVKYLADLNKITPQSRVRIGQALKVEGDIERDDAVSAAKTSSNAGSKSTEAYTVKSGESLHAISSRLGISTADLAALNDLSARAGLRVGQVIQIPKLITDYKVKRGDTLIGLASKFGLDTQALAEMNDIKPSTQLRIGEVIKVPNL